MINSLKVSLTDLFGTDTPSLADNGGFTGYTSKEQIFSTGVENGFIMQDSVFQSGYPSFPFLVAIFKKR